MVDDPWTVRIWVWIKRADWLGVARSGPLFITGKESDSRKGRLEMGFTMNWERWLQLVDHPIALAVLLLLTYVALGRLRHRFEISGHQSPWPVRPEP